METPQTHCYAAGTVTLLWKCYKVHRSGYHGKPNMSQYIFCDINVYTQILCIKILFSLFRVKLPIFRKYPLRIVYMLLSNAICITLVIKSVVKIEIKIFETKFQSLHVD
jgi:hypothetical protein